LARYIAGCDALGDLGLDETQQLSIRFGSVMLSAVVIDAPPYPPPIMWLGAWPWSS